MKSLDRYFAIAMLVCAMPATGMAKSDKINGYIGGLYNQLHSHVGDVPGNRYFADMSFDYYNNNPQSLKSRFTVAALINDESLFMGSVQEAYLAKTFNEKHTINVGRQILDWSPIDAAWGFGHLNNRRNFNFFEPGVEGLIGASYGYKAVSGFKLHFFGSGLYVPEINPGLDIDKKNKTVTSRHPWASPPARTAELDGVMKTIQYNIKIPKISDVIFRYSAGLNLGYESKHWVIDNFFIRKPENKMSTKVELVLQAVGIVQVYAAPEFYYHDVFGSSIKYKNKDLTMYISGLGVHPNTFPDGQREFGFTEIKTEKRREAYGAWGISKINDRYGLGLGYIARLSPFDRTQDILAVDPRWNQAVNAYGMLTLSKYFNILGDIKYDMLTQDRLAMLRVNYNIVDGFQLSTGINMIGTPDDGRSYWSPFTNNDMAYVAAKYIF